MFEVVGPLCRLGVEGIPRQAGGISRSTPFMGPRDGEVEVRVGVDQRGVDGVDRSCVLSQGTMVCLLKPAPLTKLLI